MSPLLVVPCRHGSKGIPAKNFKLFCGRPLWHWTRDVTLELGWNTIWTADSDGADLLVQGGIPYRQVFRRPERDTEDLLPMIDIAREAVNGRAGDPIVLLQPTSPIRTAEMVRHGVMSLEPPFTSVVSVIPVDPAQSPGRLGTIDYDQITFESSERRQMMSPKYARDGLFYITRRGTFWEHGWYGPKCRPFVHPYAVPALDEPEQWRVAESLARTFAPERFSKHPKASHVDAVNR